MKYKFLVLVQCELDIHQYSVWNSSRQKWVQVEPVETAETVITDLLDKIGIYTVTAEQITDFNSDISGAEIQYSPESLVDQ